MKELEFCPKPFSRQYFLLFRNQDVREALVDSCWIQPGNCERFIYFKEVVHFYLFTFFPTSEGVRQLQNFNSWWLTTIKKTQMSPETVNSII